MSSIYFSSATKSCKSLFLTAVLVLTCFQLNAQQWEQVLIDFKIRKPETVDVLKGADGNFIFTFLNPRQLQLTNVSKTYTYTSSSFELDKSLHRADYLLSIRDGKYHTTYFYHERLRTIKTHRIDLSLGTTQVTDCGVIPKEEEDFLTSFQLNNKFYLITVSINADLLHVWESSQGNDFVKTSFPVQHPKLHRVFETREEDLNERKYSDIGIDKIDYTLENNLKSAHATNKLYLINGKIVLTIDEPNELWLYTIDPVQKTLDEKKLAFDLEVGAQSNKQGNSFLYNDKLFRVTSNDAMLNVVMIRLDSMKMEWNQKVFPDQPILFKNGPIITESSSTQKVLGKTAQYFNRVQNSKICIAVNNINDQYLLQIGSYEFKESWNGSPNGSAYPRVSVGGGFGGVGIGMGYPMGSYYGWGMPGYYYGYPGYYPSNSYTYIESTYFYSLIDAGSLQHVDLAPPKTLREKLNEYEDQKFKNGMPDLIKVVPLSDKTILMGYYLRSAHKYSLVEIR